jgi:hypothetical protein
MSRYIKKLGIYLSIASVFVIVCISPSYAYAALSCSITTAAACSGGTILLRMSAATNAHAELPSQSTAGYASNVVCCTGIAGTGTSCSGNYATIAKLSAVTNAHVEQNSQTNYGQSACLSDSAAGDVITIAYQSSNCTGYDTTLFSMASTPTNSHVGSPADYTNKVCATIVPQSITFSINNNAISFGAVTSSALKYANTGSGSGTDTTAFSIDVTTNAPGGYALYMQGDPPKKGSAVITAIGGTPATPSIGTKAFGLRAVATGGTGTVSSTYSGSGFAYDADANTATTLASESTGDNVTTTYAVHAVASIDALLDSGDYSANITYIATGSF